MKLSDWLTIAAIIIGPVAAWLLSHYMTVSKEKRERKMNIFRTLMATRSSFLRMRLEHVGVLNTIPVEFSDKEDVLNAWRTYISHMNSTGTGEEFWHRVDDAFYELVHQISKAVGYSLDKDHLKNSSYAPSGYLDEANDQLAIRKALREVLDNKKSIPVVIRPPS